ncbi:MULTISPECIES: DUF6769 family protein [unclassified Bacteroides]|mgnify:CR=1|jgi:hypothetical protein|uniref:DUF6769 family protein n=1 Tax=unclassified Bacteroides TaxID=2646097 RepID=UPI000E86D22C|nr:MULTISPECIES: DUF6769 family protein [unclassified Bacteroides]RGN43703.1 hypothetical protein DXB63_15455 [Bacteroides sp. OM05-12]RHR71241.1 hypothetical protein DWW69_17770 [Bacteroides sp. AF16-49]
MKQRINIAWLLMMVCMIMLTASVLPHHHHKGLLCLQHDATEKECSAPVEQDSHNSSTCKACCVTKFNCARPDSDDSIVPDYTLESVLFTLTDIYLLPLLQEECLIDTSYYYEHLHSRHVSDAVGLRAPPFIVRMIG